MKKLFNVMLLLFLSTSLQVLAAENVLRVLTYNIHHAEGMDGVVDVERIANVIKDSGADLVALQEVDRAVERTYRTDIPRVLARLTGMEVRFGKNIDHQGGDYGNAILSAYPIRSTTNYHFEMIRDGEQRGLLITKVNVMGHEMIFMSTHLDYRPDDAERVHNVGEIEKIMEAYHNDTVLIGGDFNDVPDSPTHQNMKKMFKDSWEIVGEGDGFTISSTNPRKRIDYIFFKSDGLLKPINAKVINTEASDHLPLLVEFEIGK